MVRRRNLWRLCIWNPSPSCVVTQLTLLLSIFTIHRPFCLNGWFYEVATKIRTCCCKFVRFELNIIPRRWPSARKNMWVGIKPIFDPVLVVLQWLLWTLKPQNHKARFDKALVTPISTWTPFKRPVSRLLARPRSFSVNWPSNLGSCLWFSPSMGHIII